MTGAVTPKHAEENSVLDVEENEGQSLQEKAAMSETGFGNEIPDDNDGEGPTESMDAVEVSDEENEDEELVAKQGENDETG